MPSLRSSLPPTVRRTLGRWRVGAIHRLGGVVPTRGLTYDELVTLLFPHGDDPDVRRAVDREGAGDLTDPATIRRMIGAVEQQVSPTAFTVRFGPGDVTYADVHGVHMALDGADASVATQMERSGSYESHLTAVFDRFCTAGMTVVDVGANNGYYSLLAARLVGPAGRVVAVEPNSENCRLLLTSAALGGVATIELFPLACTASRGWAYFSSHIGSNGGLIPADDLVRRPGTVVPTFPLDDLVDGPVHFLKLDVEGAEGLVVAGARRLLETHRPIVTTELSCDMLPRVSGVEPADYLQGFVDLGYSLSVVERPTGTLREVATPAELLDTWDDPFRIEDLLLLPR